MAERAIPSGDDRAGRHRALAILLGVVALVAAATALVGLVAPGEVREATAAVTVGLLAGAPLLRSAWLGVRWVRRGDLRYAAVAAAVLAIAATGGTVALLTG